MTTTVTLPPLWLVHRARELHKAGVSLFEVPHFIVPEITRRVAAGDLETATWHESETAWIGMQAILNMWRGDDCCS